MSSRERLLFSVASLVILTIVGFKLNEVDLAVVRFFRSFNAHEINWIGDLLGTLGKGEVVAAVFLLVRLIGWELKNERLKQMGWRGMLAMLYVTVVAQLLKHLIGRPRPRLVHSDYFSLGPSIIGGMDSFPSGHAINAFGAAAVVAWFSPRLRVPVYLAAGIIGFSRLLRGSHFPTDIFAGAVLGVLLGSLAAAGYQSWRDRVLPAFMRTGVPLFLFGFLIVWGILQPAPAWSYSRVQLGMGLALVLLGGMARVWGLIREGERGPFLRTAGDLFLILGLGIACGPWWLVALFLMALLPRAIDGFRSSPWPVQPGRAALWGREAVLMGGVLVTIAAIRSLQGMIPLG